MPFSYYKRLSARSRRIYDRSNQVGALAIPAPQRLRPWVDGLAQALQSAARAPTEAAAQKLCDALLQALQVPGVKVRVLAKRPSRRWGELHGLYEPQGDGKPKLTVWMRTAQRRQVVAFRTFLRTLLHEIGHHLDYELLGLEDSLHTEGFYKRESSLFRQLLPDAEQTDPGRRPPSPAVDAVPAAQPDPEPRGAAAVGAGKPAALQRPLPFEERGFETEVAPQGRFRSSGREPASGSRRKPGRGG